MLQKDNATTTLSKSGTSRTGPGENHQNGIPVQYVKGVGPGLGSIFSSRGIETVRDLLFFFPRTYQDRRNFVPIADLEDGTSATIAGQVVSSRRLQLRSRRRIFEVRCMDSTGSISLKWFHTPRGIEGKFTPGTQITGTGTVKNYMGQPQMVHPEITFGVNADSSSSNVGRVVPIYSELEGISSRTFRKVLWNALEKYQKNLREDLPERFREKHSLPLLNQAVREIHFPENADLDSLIEFNTSAHRRLIYEEFFKFELLVLRQRLRAQKDGAHPLKNAPENVKELKTLLPFQLTSGQEKAVESILRDLTLDQPMNRLVQGDVGSGKTAVAFLSAGCVLAEGGQVAMMAPTEILAEQHFKNALKTFGGRLNSALLTGKTAQKERKKIYGRLLSGEPLLLVGTHALIEDPVRFKNLQLVLIDEQHRFGVDQRRKLKQKGEKTKNGKRNLPHTLVLTATPIPRTLALTAYGDLAVSSIRELPPGRSPIRTKVVYPGARASAYQKIRDEIRDGRQAYFIYPLVNDSEAEGFESLKSAVAEAERLQNEVFPEFKIGLLHGQMTPDEKAKVMGRFSKNDIQILVSTTVVEVGVDVPNSTVICVEHSERFGLSQLHQLRGRVGRAQYQSYCFLFTSERTRETSAARLDVLEKTSDGFKIAEADLEIRGPGEFLGTRQSGSLPFKMANLIRDQIWLERAREDAIEVLKADPDLEKTENRSLRRYFEREGKNQSERLNTS